MKNESQQDETSAEPSVNAEYESAINSLIPAAEREADRRVRGLHNVGTEVLLRARSRFFHDAMDRMAHEAELRVSVRIVLEDVA